MVFLVTIGTITFDASPTAGGSSWICTGLDGWYSSPPMRGKTDDRPVADGAFGSWKNYRSARALTFSGFVVAKSTVAAQEALTDAFASIQSDGTPIPLTVQNDAGIRTLAVTLDGEVTITPMSAVTAASVTASFIAYDPLKYGPTRSVSTGLGIAGGGLAYNLGDGGSPAGSLNYGANGTLGRVTLANSGTASAYPVVTVTGQLDNGFYIQCLETGSVVRYDRVVPAGSVVGLDFRTESVTVDGVAGSSTYLTIFNWFTVPPNGSITVQFNSIGTSSGTPTMTATIADPFW